MITHSFIVACVDSHSMASRQIRWMARILPANWEMIFIDDGSLPEIPIPEERPANFTVIRTRSVRYEGEWTQHLAIHRGVMVAKGEYFIKSDIDHIFTAMAIARAERFAGDAMLFRRRWGILTDNLTVQQIDFPETLYGPVDDIFVMRRDTFLKNRGYQKAETRSYGHGGFGLHGLTQTPEAQNIPQDAIIYVTPESMENYHSVSRGKAKY